MNKNVTPVRLQAIGIKANQEFVNEQYIDDHSLEFSCAPIENKTKSASVFLQITYTKYGLADEYNLTAICVWEFKVDNKSIASTSDLYYMIEYSTKYLSDVLSRVYMEQEREIQVLPASFVDNIDDLSEALEDLQSL